MVYTHSSAKQATITLPSPKQSSRVKSKKRSVPSIPDYVRQMFTPTPAPYSNGMPKFPRASMEQWYKDTKDLPFSSQIAIIPTAWMNEITSDRHWEQIVHPTGLIFPEMVREFYANLPGSLDRRSVFVRGKVIQLTSRSLNIILEIPHQEFNILQHPEWDQFRQLTFANRFPPQQVLDVIAIPGARWEYTNGSPKRLATNMLLFESYCWFTIIIHNIMPTTRTDYVSFKRCILIYAILRNIDIDVAPILFTYIEKYTSKRRLPGCYFPVWITQLCLAADVPIDCNEVFYHPLIPLGMYLMRMRHRAALHTPKRARELPPEDAVTTAELQAQIVLLRRENVLMWRHHTSILEQMHNGIKSFLNDGSPGKFGTLPVLHDDIRNLLTSHDFSDVTTPATGSSMRTPHTIPE